MKIKVFIVTYNNNQMLDKCVDSLLNSDLTKYDYQITIINNYSVINKNYGNKCVVLNNLLRLDTSTGHLSRNWNQAIILGFVDLTKPDCDILVCCQNDCQFTPNWCKNIIEYHKKYDFLTFGIGDCFHSYTPNAVKKIGLWDERFCNIGYQEADYFLRALIYHGSKSSINDLSHKRIHNPLNNNVVINTPSGFQRRESSHLESMKYHNISENLFKTKWNIAPKRWNVGEIIKTINNSLIPNFIYYPYFEKDVENLKQHNYVL